MRVRSVLVAALRAPRLMFWAPTAVVAVVGLCGCPASNLPGPGNGPEGAGAGQLVFSQLRTAILSVSGASSTQVYAVGGDLGDGEGPNVLHYDGRSWRRIPTGQERGDLWWISVTPIDERFYLAGSFGTILRFDPATQTFERFDTPGEQTLFGVWGTHRSNLWAVGGDLDNEDFGGVVWHFDGSAWTVQDLAELDPRGLPTLFKVWGRSANEIYAVGRRGVALRYDGRRWSHLESGTTRSLFTVHGNDRLVIACGGFGDGVVLELVGDRFSNRVPGGTPQLNGVFVPGAGPAVCVGNEAALALRFDGAWQVQSTDLETFRDFHATWVDSEGGIWAVGGNLNSDLDEGIVAYFGDRFIGTDVARE